jgi:hypothetical protein
MALAVLSTSPYSALAQQSTRPLGVLISSSADTQPRVGSVLPSPAANSNSTRPATDITQPEKASTSSRPLGSLINVPTSAPANSSVLPQNWNQKPGLETVTSPAPSRALVTKSDRSRPLGTLFNDPSRRRNHKIRFTANDQTCLDTAPNSTERHFWAIGTAANGQASRWPKICS